eukprot:m.180074 g.180074  ORF g.180074 m.180074 type:complete len:602 (-) comp32003_c0_seq1:257-2062(-)
MCVSTMRWAPQSIVVALLLVSVTITYATAYHHDTPIHEAGRSAKKTGKKERKSLLPHPPPMGHPHPHPHGGELDTIEISHIRFRYLGVATNCGNYQGSEWGLTVYISPLPPPSAATIRVSATTDTYMPDSSGSLFAVTTSKFFPTETTFQVFDAQGQLAAEMSLDTSCAYPIQPGHVFGFLMIVSMESSSDSGAGCGGAGTAETFAGNCSSEQLRVFPDSGDGGTTRVASVTSTITPFETGGDGGGGDTDGDGDHGITLPPTSTPSSLPPLSLIPTESQPTSAPSFVGQQPVLTSMPTPPPPTSAPSFVGEQPMITEEPVVEQPVLTTREIDTTWFVTTGGFTTGDVQPKSFERANCRVRLHTSPAGTCDAPGDEISMKSSAGFSTQMCTTHEFSTTATLYLSIQPTCGQSNPQKWTICSWSPDPSSILCNNLGLECCDRVVSRITPQFLNGERVEDGDVSCHDYYAGDCNPLFAEDSATTSVIFGLELIECLGDAPPDVQCSTGVKNNNPAAAMSATIVWPFVVGLALVMIGSVMAYARRRAKRQSFQQRSPSPTETSSLLNPLIDTDVDIDVQNPFVLSDFWEDEFASSRPASPMEYAV